jgi:MFS family permease
MRDVSSGTSPSERRRVVIGASLGTLFEWYDFFLYGALAGVIGRQFFAGVGETAAFIFALLAFAAGFAVRPFGALLFGRIGDRSGRKRSFLITIIIMGAATFLVGLLPTYAQAGMAAPAALVGLRILQGLAVGGEYGGAAIYVAEHAPDDRRGYYTSWIQGTATFGLLLALLLVAACRFSMPREAFEAWGWRLPFLGSIVLLGISVWIRVRLEESPTFRRMVAEGRTSSAPLTESFLRRRNLGQVMLALFGVVAGAAAIWAAGQFYLLLFLMQTLRMDEALATLMVTGALLLVSPLFILFGWLSDRIGRKPVLMFGLAVAVLTILPIFKAIAFHANPALAMAQERAPISVLADPARCSVQFDPVGTARFTSDCDVARALLAKRGISYRVVDAAAGSATCVRVGLRDVCAGGAFLPDVEAALRSAGYPEQASAADVDVVPLMLLIILVASYGAIVYAPIAAALVELFPPQIRYSSMSLPYHIGAGWFGGFLGPIAFTISAATGNSFAGLYYPLGVGCMSLIVIAIFLPETRGRPIDSPRQNCANAI